MQFQVAPTADGSISCIDRETGQLCHNSAGAYTEAVQNYVIPSGLRDKIRQAGHIRVLDACYGMGYNSWALINELLKDETLNQVAEEKPLTISIVAIEKHPEVMTFLPQVLEHPSFDALKEKIPPFEHNTYYRTLIDFDQSEYDNPESRTFITSVATKWRIEFQLWIDDLRFRVARLEEDFDAVFHDPFSPQKMPELWTTDLFAAYHRLLQKRNGILLTYSTAAGIRGGLQEAGFSVLKTKGLGKKAGGTLACATTTGLELYEPHTIPLEAWEQEYLQSRAGIPYRDAGLSQSREAILALREAEQQASSKPTGSQALKKKPRYTPKS
jgi:tRNA U34 5-methylaminomethyl-2-thiouridine-forming methyltransferase MnmC